jgi:hypothetical protein
MAEVRTIAGGNFFPLVATNPQSVCCDEALLATALRSVGVSLHEAIPFKVTQECDVTAWHWLFSVTSKCGTYKTAQLVKWWRDAEWLAANATHEWAVIHRVLTNHATCAREIRETQPRIILRRGAVVVEMPANASDEYRAFIIGQIEGTIAQSAVFTGEKTK